MHCHAPSGLGQADCLSLKNGWLRITRCKPNGQRLQGDEAFRLYETFGMPLDFMVDAARDAGIGFRHGGL